MNSRFATGLALCLLLACSREPVSPPATTGDEGTTSAPAAPAPPPPTAEQAAAIIRDSAEFGDYKFDLASWTVQNNPQLRNDAANDTLKQLVAAGWLQKNGDTYAPSAKAAGDKRFLQRPDGSIDIVPLAKKEFVSADGVTAGEDGEVTVPFTWRWIPNEVASSVKSGPLAERFAGDQKSVATLQYYDGAWTVLRIR